MSVQAERAKEKSESCVGPGRGLPQGGARGVGAGGGGGASSGTLTAKSFWLGPPLLSRPGSVKVAGLVPT